MVIAQFPRVPDIGVEQARQVLQGVDQNRDGYVNVTEIDAWLALPRTAVVYQPGTPAWEKEQQTNNFINSLRNALQTRNRNVDSNGDGYLNFQTRYGVGGWNNTYSELSDLARNSASPYLIEATDFTTSRPMPPRPEPPRPIPPRPTPRPPEGGGFGNRDFMQFILMFFLMQLFGGNRGGFGGSLF